MEKPALTPVSKLGEFGLIEHLTQSFPLSQSSSVKGVGDDAAVIDNKAFKTVVTTDMLVEGVHFDLSYVPLMHLGYKAVVVNLSDIFAMNAQPKQITVSMALSSKFTVEALDELYAGIRHACNAYGVDLIGGDTTSSTSGLIISITAIGQGNDEQLTFRNGAKPGDLIVVSGDLGAAYLGLQLLEREKQVFLENPEAEPDFSDRQYLVRRFLKPEARKDVIALFEEMNLKPTSMIDLSDGLSSDLMHICKQSQTGAVIEEAQLPIADEAYHQALEFNMDPTTCMLNGGEDYELLFTIHPDDETKIAGSDLVTIIGQITNSADGLVLHTKGGHRHPLKAQGWRHF
ncbi:MAG: thiamine-phosphate kinase [Chitinophagales bacterium]